MRIHKIVLENITSLKGRHEIDFDDFLKGNDLFAITGKTGSGKSSILNALSLCLYGSTYKNALNGQDFVTQGESEAKIEVSFSMNSKIYTSYWNMKVLKNNGDAVKKPKSNRKLVCDEVTLEATAKDIIGLDFDQFSKTIILNQGQFSKFLTSTFTERKNILEKIYNGDELSYLSKHLRKKIKDYESELSILEAKLEGGLPFSEKEYKEVLVQIDTSKERIEVLRKSLDQLKCSKQDIEKLIEINNSINDTSKEYEIKNVTFIKSTKEKELRTKEFEDFTKEHKELFKNFNCESSKLNKAISIIESITTLEQLIKENIDLKTKKSTSLDNFNKKLKAVELTIENKEKEIENSNISFNLLEIEEVLNVANSKNAILKQLIPGKKQDLENLGKINADLLNIEEEGKKIKSSVEKLKDEIDIYLKLYNVDSHDQLRDRKSTLFLQYSEYQRFLSSQEDEKDSLKKQKDSIKNKKEQLEKDVIRISKEIEEQRRNLEVTNLKLENFSLKSSIYQLQLLANEEKHCKVCDTKVDMIPVSPIEDIETLKNEKKETENKVDLLNKSLIKCRNDLEIEKHKEESLSKESSKLNKKNIEFKQKIIQISQSINIDFDKINNDFIEKFNRDFNSTLNKINLLKENTITLKSRRDHFKTLKSNKDNLESSIAINSKKIEDDSNWLKQKLELSGRKDILNESVKKIEVLNSVKNMIKEKDNADKEFSYTKETIKDLNIDLERIRDIEKQNTSKKEALKLEYSKLNVSQSPESELKILNEKYNIANSKKEEITSSLNEVKTKFESTKSTLEILKKNLETLKKKKAPLKDLDDPEKELDEIELKIKTHTNDFEKESEFFVKNKTLVSEYEKKVKALDDASKTIAKIKKSKKRSEDLQVLIGKDEFRNFALGLIEKHLISYTNKELEYLCQGRYELIQVDSSKGHDFYIIDHWNQAQQRKISSLSGGEIFMVSLAMALGLSEVTRGKIEIDSFFIDEGFGSLDSESIEEVLECLSSIQGRGKMIGIISHVQSLTSRIENNISLQKGQLGNSTLSYMYN